MHNQYDLAIKLELDKKSLFSHSYNFFKLKLDLLHKYINKILIKKLITFSKSFLKAFITFTNKKNRDLHLYINYLHLNAITKKTSIHYF